MNWMSWLEWRRHCLLTHSAANADAVLYHAIRDMHEGFSSQLHQIKEKVHHMSQKVDALVLAFGSFSTAFATYAEDTKTALADIAAKQEDPADAAKIQAVIDGLGDLSAQAAELDAAVKSADPGPASATDGGATPPTS